MLDVWWSLFAACVLFVVCSLSCVGCWLMFVLLCVALCCVLFVFVGLC